MMTSPPDGRNAAPGHQYAVLVVDDDAKSLHYVGSALLTEGYRVHVAASGRLAIDIAREVGPDLILLDIRMAGLDGIATCQELKRLPETRAIPVVFLTGRDDEPSMLEAFDAGGVDYLVKPFETRILLARVRTHAELGVLSRGLETALADRTQALQAANAALRQLATDMSLMEETEKARLAAGLHDGPMQKLALAQLQIEAGISASGDRRSEAAPSEDLERLGVGVTLLREAMAELRALQFALSPPVLHQRGLPAALDWLAGDTRARWDIALDCEIDAEVPRLNQRTSVILFQCVRELVHNMVKHSGARRGCIALSADAGHLLLSVVDDGRGFEASVDQPIGGEERGGYGLYSVRERLALLGGSLAIESDDRGSRISARIPLSRHGAGAADLADVVPR